MGNKQFFSFYLGDSLYAVDILYVREIIQNFNSTDIDHSYEKMFGLLNLRGQIVNIIDTSRAFGNEKTIKKQTSICIIIKTDNELRKLGCHLIRKERPPDEVVGLIADKEGEVYNIDEHTIDEPPPNLRKSDLELLKGVVKLESKLMMVIDLKKILQNG